MNSASYPPTKEKAARFEAPLNSKDEDSNNSELLMYLFLQGSPLNFLRETI